ncbi:MAG: amidohydrolase family protein, partial [Deltaproteobacteria bacterium]|nr:amidohydrolase family protein [Deltaproteobacteria bacterium]
MKANQLFINGNIVTMAPQSPEATAFAIMGDRFCAVGRDDEIRQWIAEDTRVVDLEGRTVIPGFIETHNHMSMYAVRLSHTDCGTPPNQEIEEVKARLKETAASLKPGEWVIGWGYDDTLITDNRHLTRVDLDKACPENPAFVSHISGHLAYVNSRALEIAGLGPQTPQPAGGEIRKDERGEPTG